MPRRRVSISADRKREPIVVLVGGGPTADSAAADEGVFALVSVGGLLLVFVTGHTLERLLAAEENGRAAPTEVGAALLLLSVD